MPCALTSRILPLLLVATSSLSQVPQNVTVREIRVSGNHALRDDQILDAMASKRSRDYQAGLLATDKERILVRYRQEGYCFAGVDIQPRQLPGDSSLVALLVTVNEGPRAVVGQIALAGNNALQTSAILDAFETRSGDILDPATLEKDIRTLVSRYERIGYPYAAINVEDIALMTTDSASQLRIRLSIDEGSKVTINEVRVQGNKETSEHVIVREARVSPPELYDEEKVSKIRERLNKLNIFSSVQEPELYSNREGGGLLISVEESNTNTFDGVIGYVPGGQHDEGGAVTGMVNVVMRNLFGTARKLDVRWQRDDRYSQEIGIRYVEPWVFDIPVNIGGNFFQRQQDTIYVRRVAGLTAEMMFSDAFSLGGSLQQENIIPSTTIATQAVSNSRTLTAGITLRYDTRDDIINPTSGVNYRTDYLFGGKKIYSTPFAGAPEHSTVQKISIDAEAYIEPIDRQVIALGLHGRQITSDNIEVSDRFRFGGTNSLRGYRENQFLGSRIAWTNAEYRFLLARRSFFFGFFDTGYYFIPADDQHGIPSSQSVNVGYGVGVRVETSLGIIGVSIALGEGDSFSQAKLHLGLINEF